MMRPAPHDLRISAARADALFESTLQRSDEPSEKQVKQAIAAAIGAFGDLGCAARVAGAYGEHPESAVTRMRWARMTVAAAFGGSQPEPACARTLGQYAVSSASSARHWYYDAALQASSTRSPRGCEQQISALPSTGSSTGSGA
jgi:hypothetical protein